VGVTWVDVASVIAQEYDCTVAELRSSPSESYPRHLLMYLGRRDGASWGELADWFACGRSSVQNAVRSVEGEVSAMTGEAVAVREAEAFATVAGLTLAPRGVEQDPLG